MMLTVVVFFLEVHVDNASGEDGRHLIAVKGADFGEFARSHLIAAILGEEGRNRVASEFLNTLIKSGLGKR